MLGTNLVVGLRHEHHCQRRLKTSDTWIVTLSEAPVRLPPLVKPKDSTATLEGDDIPTEDVVRS